MSLINPHFDDIYALNGLAEKEHVFVHGNNLPARFASLKSGEFFCVFELGFGLGLAFEATLNAWQQHAPTGAQLQFYSVEKYPVEVSLLANPALLARFWGALQPGWNTWKHNNVQLRLFYGDVLEALDAPALPAIQAWFLDGHDPRKNPTMWQPAIFEAMQRLTALNGTAATYSCAGEVRCNLAHAGFEVRKTPGMPPKRHNLAAVKIIEN